MLTEDQRMQMMYTGVSAFRNTEVSLRWARSQLLTAVNTAVIPILIAQTTTSELHRLIGIIGLLLCAFWLWVNKRTQRYIDYWQQVLISMEPPETNLLMFRVFTGSGWKYADQWPNFYQILNILPWIFILIWSTLLIASSYELPFQFFQWTINLFKGGA